MNLNSSFLLVVSLLKSAVVLPLLSFSIESGAVRFRVFEAVVRSASATRAALLAAFPRWLGRLGLVCGIPELACHIFPAVPARPRFARFSLAVVFADKRVC